jgi:peptide deformylase
MNKKHILRGETAMALRTIRLEGDEILRKKSKPVKEITPTVLTLLDDMAETLKEAKGAGLAAPQVGILKRVVIIDVGEGLIEMINPEVIETRGTRRVEEACLSVPGESGLVERPEYVKVKYLDRTGAEQTVEGTELLGLALCHETDHLDGVLYIDKVLEMFDDDDYEDDDDDDEEEDD